MEMASNLEPFVYRECTLEELLLEVARESRSRKRTTALKDTGERLGLERLATIIDAVRMMEGLGWKDFALSARPKPLNPLYLMLMSMGLIAREEITDEVFSALAILLSVREGSLRSMFIVEEADEPQGIWSWLRVPKIRISAPFDTFPRPTAAATLGQTSDANPQFGTREAVFRQAGLTVRYTITPDSGLVVDVETANDSGRRLPGDLEVSVVSNTDGSLKAGPFRLKRGRAECGRIDWDPLDRLVIERGNHG